MKIRISNLCPVQTIRLRMLSPARALCMIATAAPALLILLTALPAAAQTSRPKSPPVDAVLQARKPPVTARTLADNTGQIWGTTPNALLRWDGQAGSWQETPITIPPRPQWLAHPAPPWQGWATPPRIIIGRGDYLLAVVVCDIAVTVATGAPLGTT